MDFGSPVAQNVNVDPGKGLQTLSDLVNFQRSKVALQQQQQDIQSKGLGIQQQQAELQQTQQSAGQRAGTASFMQNFDPTKHVGADGTLDLDGVFSDPKLRQAAGDNFPQLMQQMLAVKQGQLTAKQSLVDLNASTRNQLQQQLGALRTDPDVVNDTPAGRQKVNDVYDSFSENGPTEARVASLYKPMTQHAPAGQLAQALSIAQLQGQSAAQQSSTQAPSFTDTGGNLVNTNPQAAGGTLGAQPALTKGLSPTDQPGYRARVASVTGTAGTLATGAAGVDVDRQAEVSKGVQAASAGIPLTQQADRLVDMIDSGKAAQWLAEKKIAIGSNSPESVARVELGKILSAVRNNSAASAGAKSVEGLQQQAEANPQSNYPAEAVHAAMDVARGSMRQQIERNQNLAGYTKTHGDAGGFAASDSALTSARNPLAVEYNSITDPAAKAAFIKRQFPNDRAAAKAFMESVRGSYHAVPGG